MCRHMIMHLSTKYFAVKKTLQARIAWRWLYSLQVKEVWSLWETTLDMNNYLLSRLIVSLSLSHWMYDPIIYDIVWHDKPDVECVVFTEDSSLALKVASYILIGVGAFSMLMGFVGCLGAIYEIRCLLGLVCVCVCVSQQSLLWPNV